MADEILHMNILYVGEKWRQDGKKQDGTEYKLYEVTYKDKADKNAREYRASCFTPLNENSIPFEQLKKGAWYEMAYRESEYKNKFGTMSKGKTIIGFSELSEATPTQQKEGAYSFEQAQFEKFAQAYLAKVDKDKQSVSGMLGAYLMTYHRDTVAGLEEACNKAMGKK